MSAKAIINPGDNCQPLRSRPRSFGPNVFFVTVAGQAVGGADIDFHVILPQPAKRIQIASILTPQNSVYFHFNQLNKNYGGGNAINPTGRENWIPMTDFIVATAAPWYWTTLEFDSAILDFYLDMGHENGAANVITFMCTPEGSGVNVYGGPWT